jgi:hypothetical protein
LLLLLLLHQQVCMQCAFNQLLPTSFAVCTLNIIAAAAAAVLPLHQRPRRMRQVGAKQLARHCSWQVSQLLVGGRAGSRYEADSSMCLQLLLPSHIISCCRR